MINTAPAYRYAHNSGVQSLAWLSDLGQILAVGCTKRNVQLYDLRISGTNAPPTSVFAHTDAVHGIVPDMTCPTMSTFATFGRNVGEPVKIWDARMMDSTITEITPQNGGVSSVAWSYARPGVLSIAIGDSIRNYDTRSPGSRSLPVGVSYLDAASADDAEDDVFIQCLAYQPQFFDTEASSSDTNPFEYYPHRKLAVTSQGQIQVIPELYTAPLSISKRDGRVASCLGGTVWIGPTTDNNGPSSILTEDISARMMRRARCFHDTRYSTDANDNVRMLEEEKEHILAQKSDKSLQQSSASNSHEFNQNIANIDMLAHCWRWIALIEHLSIEQRSETNTGHSTSIEDDTFAWPAKGLIDAGVMKLLRMSSRRDNQDESGNPFMDTKKMSDTLFCDVFDSPMRR